MIYFTRFAPKFLVVFGPMGCVGLLGQLGLLGPLPSLGLLGLLGVWLASLAWLAWLAMRGPAWLGRGAAKASVKPRLKRS